TTDVCTLSLTPLFRSAPRFDPYRRLGPRFEHASRARVRLTELAQVGDRPELLALLQERLGRFDLLQELGRRFGAARRLFAGRLGALAPGLQELGLTGPGDLERIAVVLRRRLDRVRRQQLRWLPVARRGWPRRICGRRERAALLERLAHALGRGSQRRAQRRGRAQRAHLPLDAVDRALGELRGRRVP